MASSVIFIGSPEKSPKHQNNCAGLFCVPPNDIAFRIFASFMPPIGKRFRKVYVDFLGPLLGLVILGAFVNYGYKFKVGNDSLRSPTEAILLYSILMPPICFVLSRLGGSTVTLSETATLIGYGLYGHFITLLISFVLFEERSNFCFFLCLVIFGGLSTLRVVLVFMWTIGVPVARLLICTCVSVANILYLIFLHFAYMHPTFV